MALDIFSARKKRYISILLVGLFALSALTVIAIIPEPSEGNFQIMDKDDKRLDGEVDFYNGDKADQMWEGTTQYSYMGSSVVAGDIDGDGFDDYIIGAQGESSDSGEVYIYFGMKNVHPRNDPNNANISISGSGTYAYFGMSVAIGDVNGDNIDDLIIGADGANNYAGGGYIFFGKTTWPDKATMKDTNADVIFVGDLGTYKTGYFGHFCGSGDIDGDGMDEVVFNAPYYTDEDLTGSYGVWGMTYIWWGRQTWNSKYDTTKGEYDTSIFGKQADSSGSLSFYVYESLGNQKPFIGDMNGDGAGELIVGGYSEAWFDSDDPTTYATYCGGVHILEGTRGDRSKWTKDMTIADLAEDDPDLPKHHWMYSGASGHYWGGYVFGADMNGDGFSDLIVSQGTSSGNGYIFFGDGDLDSFGGATWTTRMRYSDHPNYLTLSGMTQLEVADFDKDGYYDVYGGSYYKGTSYGGELTLYYGRSDWSGATPDFTVKGAYYDELGYYYYPCLSNGDFNNDGYPDLLFGAPYHQNVQTGLSYCGGAYVILSVPPEMHIQSFHLLDGDGDDMNILTPEAGGNRYEPAGNQIGDGIYTFKIRFNDTWTVVEAQEISITFNLKAEYVGLSYEVAYVPVNESFYVKQNIQGGIQVVPERSQFRIIDYHNAEVFISVRITMNFLTQTPFDVTGKVSTARFHQEIKYQDWLYVEKDLTFNDDDIHVFRGANEIFRGDFLAGGPPMIITGVRVVYHDTKVSPMNNKFFIRVIDSYGRIFENKTSAGYDIYFEMPTNVDSGRYVFRVNIVITENYVNRMEDLSIIPDFYVALDFIGPEAPPNLALHADSETDPEGRWDDDEQVWLTWDPSYDSQVEVDHYETLVEGPNGFLLTENTEDLMTELALAGDGVYTIHTWAVDKVGNPGDRSIIEFVKDSAPISIHTPQPSYIGGVWYNTDDVSMTLRIKDLVLGEDGPHLKLSTLEYALTTDMTTAARDTATWNRASHTIIDEVQEGAYRIYTLSVKILNLKDGKDNFVWFRVKDEAGNTGMTSLVDNTDPNYKENATRFNPANIWVDITALTFTDPTPTPEPQENNIITASIIVNDLGSGVDASTVQYSISRNGLTNYGGWISAGLNENGNTLRAETVAPLLLQPGSTNYIRWRSMDVAGNGYSVSEDFPINIEARVLNNPPLAEITSPEMQAVYDTRENIEFDASGSSDPDFSELSFRWVLADKTILSEEETLSIRASDLGRGVHVVTLYVSDGEFTVTDSISIYVRLHPDEVDTDGDGIEDGTDEDDDNDGLLDIEEERLGTNPRLKDSDLDGVNDELDPEPLNPLVIESDKSNEQYSYWDILILILILAVFIILISAMVVFRRRAAMEKSRVMRNVAMEAKIVQRYETLTGVEAPLLPQVKEMGVSLPPIAAQQVVPVKRAKTLTETPNLPPTKQPEPKPQKAPQPEHVPAPAPEPQPQPVPEPEAPRRRRTVTGTTPGAVPTPEELTKTESLPGETAAPQTTTCDLCGSSIDIPSGAASVECPLCGEKKNL